MSMTTLNIGFLHPGTMGISLAAAAQHSGHIAHWISEGRSPQTRERAEKFKLLDLGNLETLCHECSVIISVCPPQAAEDTAMQISAIPFRGVFVDANAISPQRSIRIGKLMEQSGAAFVDGSIIGGPAWESGQTCLYLSGLQAEQICECFSAGPLQTRVIGSSAGKASALKMCYAAYTKGTTALLCAIFAAAEELGVRPELQTQWSQDGSGFAEQAKLKSIGAAPKAWRYVSELEEIAATFQDAGVPDGFHKAAAEIYRRLAHFKESTVRPDLDTILDALVQGAEDATVQKLVKRELSTSK
jgi:3-hydroxyisobutyrate dehydrogenase-like beta-hydroxyacid dehydrogenase